MLDSSQMTAVRYGCGPCLTIAGPGSGKTTVLTNRILNLIQEYNVPPEHILVITFTKDAARDMQKRFMTLESNSFAAVTFGTFHSIFFKILQKSHGYEKQNILTGEKKTEIIKEALRKMNYKPAGTKELFDALEKEISFVKNTAIDINVYQSKTLEKDKFLYFFKNYNALLREMHLIDFDDMLLRTYELFLQDEKTLDEWREKYQFILIDEVQDMNNLQFEVIKLLAKPHNNIFAVGDDDQSIYGFRGANPKLMMKFKDQFEECSVIKLSTNYRCSKAIVEASAKLISHNNERFKKELVAFSKDAGKLGIIKCDSPRDEAQKAVKMIEDELADSEDLRIGVLFRNHIQSMHIEKLLMERGIDFFVKDMSSSIFNHFIAKDMCSFFRIALNLASRADFLRVINKPSRYISRLAMDGDEVSIESIERYYHDNLSVRDEVIRFRKSIELIGKFSSFAAMNYIRKGMGYEIYLKKYAKEAGIEPEELFDIFDELMEFGKAYISLDEYIMAISDFAEYEANKKIQKSTGGIQVFLHTFHSSKGLEFDTVHILDVNDGITPSRKSVGTDALEEERRMFYVALTRAKEKLYMYSIKERHNEVLYPSPYLSEMLESASS